MVPRLFRFNLPYLYDFFACGKKACEDIFNDNGLFHMFTMSDRSVSCCSGAHVNFSVTFAVFIGGGIKWFMVPLYLASQLCGSLAGAALAYVRISTLELRAEDVLLV